MTTVQNIYDWIDSRAPFAAQEAWDNSGLLCGDAQQAVTRIGVVLDITRDAVSYAAQQKIDLIVSHHPVIFKPLKALAAQSVPALLIRHGMAAVCAHTSLDCAMGGVNDVLAGNLGLTAVTILPDADPALRGGTLPEPVNAARLADDLEIKLGGIVRYAGPQDRPISRIALCGGAGASFWEDALHAGYDAFLTGDASHHDFLDAAEAGFSLFAAGHFETENPVVAVLAQGLRQAFPACEIFRIPQQNPVASSRKGGSEWHSTESV